MTPYPVSYMEWGYLGGLIFIVVSFLTYQIRRDAAIAKREKAMQDFFARIYDEGQSSTRQLAEAIRELINDSRLHHRETAEAIATMKERTRPLDPRKPNA